MSFTHQVLGLHRECLQAGVEVELKLWFRGGIEYFNFSKLQAPWSLRTKKRRRIRIRRRTGDKPNHHITTQFEDISMTAPQFEERSMRAPQFEQRSMRAPQSEESSMRAPQSKERFIRAPQSEERSMRAPRLWRGPWEPPSPRRGPL